MKKHNLILVAFFSLTMATGCYNGHILDKPITMLANDKKTALMPPTQFDYSLRIFEGPEWQEWYFGTYSNSKQERMIFDTATFSSVGIKQKVFSWPYQYPLGTTYGAIVMDLTVRSLFIDNIGNGGYEWLSNSISNTNSITPILNIKLTNNSPFNAYAYLDLSKNGSPISMSYFVGGVLNGSYVVLSNTTLSRVLLPSFSVVELKNYYSSLTFEGLYIDVDSIPPGLDDEFDNRYDIGYGQGFTVGFESKGNLEWLEDVATAVKDIFSVEIFPGMTVGFIVLFPLVIAIVKWFLSLFGIGGGS